MSGDQDDSAVDILDGHDVLCPKLISAIDELYLRWVEERRSKEGSSDNSSTMRAPGNTATAAVSHFEENAPGSPVSMSDTVAAEAMSLAQSLAVSGSKPEPSTPSIVTPVETQTSVVGHRQTTAETEANESESARATGTTEKADARRQQEIDVFVFKDSQAKSADRGDVHQQRRTHMIDVMDNSLGKDGENGCEKRAETIRTALIDAQNNGVESSRSIADAANGSHCNDANTDDSNSNAVEDDINGRDNAKAPSRAHVTPPVVAVSRVIEAASPDALVAGYTQRNTGDRAAGAGGGSIEDSDVSQRPWVGRMGQCGETPLHGAAQNGHADMVQMLLSMNASVTARDIFNSTPLHRACINGHAVVAKILIKNGADPLAEDWEQNTPLKLTQIGNSALTNDHLAIIALMESVEHRVSQGLSPIKPDKKKKSRDRKKAAATATATSSAGAAPSADG